MSCELPWRLAEREHADSERVRSSRARRVAFVAWIGVSTATIGIGLLVSRLLVIAWFGANQGVANPVTDLGYGALIGIIITGGLLVQLRSPHRKIAGLQQAALAALALLLSGAPGRGRSASRARADRSRNP